MKVASEFSAMLGMVNVSFAERETGTTGPNAKEAASGSVSGIATQLTYNFHAWDKWSWNIAGTIPLLSGEGTYLSGGGGLEYTWGDPPFLYSLMDAKTSLRVAPEMRYHAGFGPRFSYISYLTETSQKNDTIIELGGYGAVSKKIGKMTYRAQAGIFRGTGVVTDTMSMQLFVGCTFFLP